MGYCLGVMPRTSLAARLATQRTRVFFVVKEPLDRSCERKLIAIVVKQPAHAVRYELWNAPHSCGNTRYAKEHGFDESVGLVLDM